MKDENKQGEKNEKAKKQGNSSENQAKNDKCLKKEQPIGDEDANYKNFVEIKEHCDRSINVMKEAQEMWKSIKEDKSMSEQQYCEGLKKISELVGNDQQSF